MQISKDMTVKAGCVTFRLGEELYTREDNLTTRGRHIVMIQALNETKYRFTNIPGALKSFAVKVCPRQYGTLETTDLSSDMCNHVLDILARQNEVSVLPP